MSLTQALALCRAFVAGAIVAATLAAPLAGQTFAQLAPAGAPRLLGLDPYHGAPLVIAAVIATHGAARLWRPTFVRVLIPGP